MKLAAGVTGVYITPELRGRLDAVARKMDRSRSWLIRRLVAEGLRRMESEG